MTVSITNEKAANPPQPTAAACGPDFAVLEGQRIQNKNSVSDQMRRINIYPMSVCLFYLVTRHR
jgi:hypothetical protein